MSVLRGAAIVAGLAAFSLALGAWAQDAAPAVPEGPYFEVRGGLENCRLTFMNEKKGRIVYIGGSITTMGGWRGLTYDMFKERFPETEFDFIDAGIGGTNSTLGAFRFEDDVFKNGPVDLLFLEFAVNDGVTEGPGNRSRRAMEGIIRRARKLNPEIDIIIQYFADQSKVADYNAGKVPPSIAHHEEVAVHYAIPIINEALEMTRRLNAGAFVWEDFSRDSCHPKPFGHEQYLACINAFLDAAWAEPPAAGAKPVARPLGTPLDEQNYEQGRFIGIDQAKIVSGWARDKAWKAEKTCNYSGAVDVLAAKHPGDTLELAFEGRLIGFNGIAGMDAGIIEYSIDGSEAKTLDLFDHYCEQFHRPVCHVLAEELAPGKHTLTLRMTGEQNAKSQGHACRILRFTAN